MRLRTALADEAALTPEDADALFELHVGCPIKDPSWAHFFIEAICDHIVNQVKPEGYMVAEKARWLIEKISYHGSVETRAELELLVTVIERARWSPPSLVRHAIDQVCHAVETGRGPLRDGDLPSPGSITEAEIDLLARCIGEFGRDTPISLTRMEADAIIAINRAIASGQSSPAWTQFFIVTVGNALLAGLGFDTPSRRDLMAPCLMASKADPNNSAAILHLALATRPATMAAAGHIGGFASQMLNASSVRIWASRRRQSLEERAILRLQRQRLEIITNESIEDADEAWLRQQLVPGARLHENEQALLAYIRQEAGTLPEAVNQLLARILIAA